MISYKGGENLTSSSQELTRGNLIQTYPTPKDTEVIQTMNKPHKRRKSTIKGRNSEETKKDQFPVLIIDMRNYYWQYISTKHTQIK